MPRNNLGEIRRRYSGLVDFLNLHLDESNWRQAVHAVAASYAIHRKPTRIPIAIAIDRDLTLKEASRIQEALKALFANERPRGMATLDAMQAVWVVAGEIVREHSGPRKCAAPGCFTYFIPRGGDRTCSDECSVKDYNARRRRKKDLAAGRPGNCPGLRGTGQSCIFDTNHAGPHKAAVKVTAANEVTPPGTFHP